jgi:hypothetical protein
MREPALIATEVNPDDARYQLGGGGSSGGWHDDPPTSSLLKDPVLSVAGLEFMRPADLRVSSARVQYAIRSVGRTGA